MGGCSGGTRSRWRSGRNAGGAGCRGTIWRRPPPFPPSPPPPPPPPQAPSPPHTRARTPARTHPRAHRGTVWRRALRSNLRSHKHAHARAHTQTHAHARTHLFPRACARARGRPLAHARTAPSPSPHALPGPPACSRAGGGWGRWRRGEKFPSLPAATPAEKFCAAPRGLRRRTAPGPVRAGPRHARRFGPAAPSPLGSSGGRLERPEAEPAAALAAAKGLPPVRMELSPTMQIAASWRCIFFGGGSAFLLHPVGLEGPRPAGGAILPRNRGAAFAHRRGLGHGGLGRRVGQRACARSFGPVSAAWARPRRSGSCRGPSPLVPQTRERKGRACGRRMLLGTGAGQFPCSPPWPVSRWALALSPACAPRRPPRRPGACPTLSAVGCPAQLASRPRAAARASDSCASAATTAH